MVTLPNILAPLVPEPAKQQVELWRYSNVAALSRYDFAAPHMSAAAMMARTNGHKLIAQDGHWQDITLPQGCVLKIDGARATLSIAHHTDLEVELVLSLGRNTAPVAAQMELVVDLGQDASLTMYEWMASAGEADTPALQTLKTTFDLAENATVQHVRVGDQPLTDYAFTRTEAAVAAGAHYQYFALVCGGRQSRHQLNVQLNGSNAQASLGGIYMLSGQQGSDHTVVIEHRAPDAQSRQHFRGVLAGQSRGAYQGKVKVDQIAQGTDAHQLHKALLLSPRAEVNTKPELEIYADAVKCSHGATVGALDDEALFYLRARGIDAQTAEQMLIAAFADAALEDAPAYQDELRAIVADWGVAVS